MIALSTPEAEYISLSSALREVIAIINVMEDLKQHGLPLDASTPVIRCRTFEENMSCISMAANHITRPSTKHLSARLQHFRLHIVNKTHTIQHISTTNQIADIFTKPLAKPQFTKLRNFLMTW